VAARSRLDPRGFAAHRNVNSAWWHWTANVVAASPAVGRERRAQLLRRCGIDVGTALVEPGCFFFGSDVGLGDWAWINHRCYFDARDRITVGAQCSLGMEVMLCTSGHEPGAAGKRAGAYVSGPIAIGDGTWLGTRALVLGGVTIGAGCIVAAGAVVTADLEPHGVYAGVPARRIRDLEP
jgi:maltose O-acetyltransferase